MSRQVMINVPGRLVFEDLVEPGGAPGFVPKYSITFQVDKNQPEIKAIFEEIQEVAYDIWDSDTAEANLNAIQSALETGVEPRFAPSPLQDGDVHDPEYNAGTFVVKATRRLDEGAPPLFAQDGSVITDVKNKPKQGDGVIVAINVWAMKKHSRINFTVEGVRLAIHGLRTGGPPPAAIAEGLTNLASLTLPTLIEGVQPRPLLAEGAPVAAAPAAPSAQVPVSTIVAPGAAQGLFRPPTQETLPEEEAPLPEPKKGPTLFELRK